jgi:hypothetical protein
MSDESRYNKSRGEDNDVNDKEPVREKPSPPATPSKPSPSPGPLGDIPEPGKSGDIPEPGKKP